MLHHPFASLTGDKSPQTNQVTNRLPGRVGSKKKKLSARLDSEPTSSLLNASAAPLVDEKDDEKAEFTASGISVPQCDEPVYFQTKESAICAPRSPPIVCLC